MRVLHLYRTYYPETQGGIEESIRQICFSLKAKGVESRVLTTASRPSPRVLARDEATVIRVKKHAEIASCSMSLSLLAEYKRQAEWADVINIHFPWPFADLIHLLSNVKKPVVITYHSDVVRQRTLNFFYKPLLTLFFKSASRIIATSPNYFATSKNLQNFSHKVDVLPLGINEDSYVTSTQQDRDYVKKTFRHPYFLFVGVLRYYKGLHILIDAAQSLDADIVIAGAGPLEDKLKIQAEKLGLSNVHFQGHVSNTRKAALLESSLAVVFPSHLRSEAFGVTLLEGTMFGKPLISTELGTGTTHVNKHKITGLVVPPGNASALHQAMNDLLSAPAATRERYSLASRARFEEKFSGDVLSENYLKLYEAVLAENLSTAKQGSA